MAVEKETVADVLGLADMALEMNDEAASDTDEDQDFTQPRSEAELEPEQEPEQELEPEPESELEKSGEPEPEPESEELEPEPEPEPEEPSDIEAMRTEIERLNALISAPVEQPDSEAGDLRPDVPSEAIQFVENMDELDELLTSTEGANKLFNKLYARVFKDVMTAAPQAMLGVAASTSETLVENAMYLRDNPGLQKFPATLRKYLEDVHNEKPDIPYREKLEEAGQRTSRAIAMNVEAAEIQGVRKRGGKPPGPPRARSRRPPREETEPQLTDGEKIVADVLGLDL